MPQGGGAPKGWGGPRAAEPEPEPTGRLDRSKAGTAAPESFFEDPDGAAVTLAEFRGKPLLVNFWATWCAPCIAEMPTLDALAARDPAIQVLTISQDMEGRPKVEAFFKERGFTTIEPYLDAKTAMMAELKIDSLPTTILYDVRGREVWRVTGIEDWQSAHAAALIKEAAGPS
jgi:thiol-disulfide isomerase/thioredoxin